MFEKVDSDLVLAFVHECASIQDFKYVVVRPVSPSDYDGSFNLAYLSAVNSSGADVIARKVDLGDPKSLVQSKRFADKLTNQILHERAPVILVAKTHCRSCERRDQVRGEACEDCGALVPVGATGTR